MFLNMLKACSRRPAYWTVILVFGLAGTGLACAQQYAAAKSSRNKPGTATGVSADARAGTISPVRLEYVVGEGDLLNINVWREPELTQNMTVRPDGNISLPLLGDVHVSGITPRQIQELLTEKLKVVLTNPQVTVSVSEVRSKIVYITGSVGKPGAYPAVTPMNVLQLIARAGGLTEFANRKDISILRGGDPRNRLHFNYKEVVKGHNSAQNVTLQPGDTVVVK